MNIVIAVMNLRFDKRSKIDLPAERIMLLVLGILRTLVFILNFVWRETLNPQQLFCQLKNTPLFLRLLSSGPFCRLRAKENSPTEKPCHSAISVQQDLNLWADIHDCMLILFIIRLNSYCVFLIFSQNLKGNMILIDALLFFVYDENYIMKRLSTFQSFVSI